MQPLVVPGVGPIVEVVSQVGYYRVNICITILSKTHFYFTAGIVDTMLKKREEQRLMAAQSTTTASAVHGAKKKNDKYLPDLPPGTKFVPFVIETGGRLAKATYEWLDNS